MRWSIPTACRCGSRSQPGKPMIVGLPASHGQQKKFPISASLVLRLAAAVGSDRSKTKSVPPGGGLEQATREFDRDSARDVQGIACNLALRKHDLEPLL